MPNRQSTNDDTKKKGFFGRLFDKKAEDDAESGIIEENPEMENDQVVNDVKSSDDGDFAVNPADNAGGNSSDKPDDKLSDASEKDNEAGDGAESLPDGDFSGDNLSSAEEEFIDSEVIVDLNKIIEDEYGAGSDNIGEDLDGWTYPEAKQDGETVLPEQGENKIDSESVYDKIDRITRQIMHKEEQNISKEADDEGNAGNVTRGVTSHRRLRASRLPESGAQTSVSGDSSDGSDTSYLIPDEADAPEMKYEDVVMPNGDLMSEKSEDTDEEPLGSTDMNLRIAFGLEENEDEEHIRGRVKKLGDHHESNPRAGKAVKPDRPEFTDPIQAKGIASDYKRSAAGLSVRLFFAAILTLLLIIYENISPITKIITGTPKQFSGILDPAVYPVVYIMVSLQILLIVCAFGFKELKLGIRRLFQGAPGAESYTLMFVLAGIIYSGFTAYNITVTTEPVMFNSVAALAVTLMIFGARLNNKREMMTFYIAGSKKNKYAVRRLPEDDVFDDADAFEEPEACDVMKVEKVKFIDSFFTRLQTPDSMKTAFVSAVMGICIVAAVLSGLYSFMHSGTFTDSMTLGYIVILTAAPMSVYVTFSYPFYRASTIAKEYDSAIIGDVSLEEYAGASVVAFEDSNIFPSFGVKVQNIRIYNNARIDRVLYYAASVFSHAGGPLSDIFGIATLDMEKSEDVTLLEADRGFLASKVDGVNIIFGSLESLTKRGISIPGDVAQDDVDFSDELSIMYMVREDMLVAKIYIKYVMDGDIELILKQFKDNGMYMCVRTYDPNIDEDMISSKVKMKDVPLKVVRFRGEDEVGVCSDKSDSGIVTNATPKSLLQVIPYCDNAVRTKKDNVALGIVSVVISMIILVLLFISGGIGRINSLFIAAYQIAWLLPSFLVSKIFIR